MKSWPDRQGYLICRFQGKDRKLHRVIWYLHYGRWPDGQLDHINQNKQDNRPENLREASDETNARNRSLRADNTSGLRGVSWRKDIKSWVARINNGGKRITLGFHKNLFDAACLRKDAEAKINGY